MEMVQSVCFRMGGLLIMKKNIKKEVCYVFKGNRIPDKISIPFFERTPVIALQRGLV
ncbi:hypothetical protein [Evansella clarkii]|uniref:hypothetical protein n=1 Tax=Evansella clarkii TaxID=79879 RepID=UPI00143101AA|nr:hypothetical protein [Evansella clarkii]